MGGQNSVGGGAFAPRWGQVVLSNEWRLAGEGRGVSAPQIRGVGLDGHVQLHADDMMGNKHPRGV